ncbi:MAG: heavy-metal-associated domain-containing protein [Armatimonadetes bacterium]|nr:heavy-metal-associated domain-containing protein [Armatimonadota bacterium]
MENTVFEVPSITCGGCAASIKKALTPLSGIRKVDVDVLTKKVSVEYDPNLVNEFTIKQKVEQAGFSL